MKASDLLVKALENEGVEYIFAVPGEENLDLLNSLKDSRIRLIVTRHEQGAGFMAATLGRITEKTGVCLATLGPGATNLVTPAAFARLGAMPMLMITGQKPIKSSKQGRFQILDVVDVNNGIYKIWFARNYKCYAPNTMLLDNALASMGAGLPSAIAAKIARPKAQVVAICGDGGFMMNSQELETAVRLELDLVVIYCLKSPGVHVIELPVDYSLNHRILNVLLKEKACQV